MIANDEKRDMNYEAVTGTFSVFSTQFFYIHYSRINMIVNKRKVKVVKGAIRKVDVYLNLYDFQVAPSNEPKLELEIDTCHACVSQF